MGNLRREPGRGLLRLLRSPATLSPPQNKRRLLLALAGQLTPIVWRQATAAALAQIGRLASFDSLDEAATALSRTRAHPQRVAPRVESARALAASARQLAAKEQFATAYDAAVTARRELLEAFCLAQTPVPDEFRGFWCHSAFGVQGMDWDEAIGRLATHGFTAILPNLLWGGVAYYPSQRLPVAASVAERGDQMAACLAACRKHGIELHAWKVNWNLGHAAPKAFVDQMRKEGRLQADAQGRSEPWLCPSHPENQQLEIASMIEVARNYDVDGLHFDYIRYPDADHCFCAGCRARFAQVTGQPLANWPGDVRGDGPLRFDWLDWRRANITAVVQAVSEQARASE